MSATSALSLNPATGEVVAKYPYQSSLELDASPAQAELGFWAWSGLSVDARTALFKRMAGVLRQKVEPLARLITQEMDEPIAQARAEVEKCAALCDWYANHGSPFLTDESTGIGDQAYVSYLPLGPILAVMPWNFSCWQVMREAVPILLGGNAYVLKHAPNVMGRAYALGEAWSEAGLPVGAFTVTNLVPDLVSKAIADPRVVAVAVTDSVRAGAAVASQAGAVLKKSVLELGGSDPFIVRADADLDAAVHAAAVEWFQNVGQICIATKRIILEASIAEAFTAKFVKAVIALKLGDPQDEVTDTGPTARFDLCDELDEQVQATLSEGAKLVIGGRKLTAAGNFYELTILKNVESGMTAFVQETFGPVASLIVARDADHAIDLASDSEFGLSSAIWLTDKASDRRMARRIDTGGVFINGFSASDSRTPFEGVKKSGCRRELSHFGVREFMNIQAVWVDRSGAIVHTQAQVDVSDPG